MAWLSWSPSRMEAYVWCNRKFYLTYYRNSLDWEKINDEEVDKWKVYFLKNLDSISTRTWKVIHSILASYFLELKKDKEFTIEQYEEKWLDKLIEVKIKTPYYLSAKRDYTLWYDAQEDKALKKKYGIIWLIEHYYKQIPEDQHDKYLAIIIDNLKSCLLWFSKSQVYQEIKKNFDKYDIYHEPPTTDFDAMKFQSQNVLGWTIDLFVQPDFYLKVKWENKYVIIDRKTWDSSQKKEMVPDQLLAEWYCIYAENWFDDNISIEWFFCNLDDNWRLTTWNKVWIESVKAYEKEINKQIDKLSENLVDHDVLLNAPVSIDKYSETKDDKKCEICAFKSVCKKVNHGK